MFNDSKNRVNLRKLLLGLSQPLREEIYSYINGETVLSLNFFKGISTNLVSRISRVLKPQVNSPREFIITEGEESLSMYFIQKGIIKIVDEKSQSTIAILSNNCYFGEIGLFTNKNRCASVVTMSFLETLCLATNKLRSLSRQFPELNKILVFLQEKTFNGDLTVLNVVCYLCKSIGHISKDCKKMVQRERLKNKWINNRKASQLINLEDCQSREKPYRGLKNFKCKELTTRNIWGLKRKMKDLYPKKNFLLRAIKKFISNIPKRSDDSESLSDSFSLMS